ncbi:MAG: ABC transporter ATP-binding protein, partial [Lachnospiraceae bacterium]|nr:ABC transporter ATP-binding protein [Lachnospiraceae bacterium]
MSPEFRAKTLKRLLVYIRRHFLLVILSLLFAVVSVVCTLYLPILTGQAVDVLVGKGNVDFSLLLSILVKIGILIGVSALSGYLSSLVNNRITYKVTAEIRKDAFDKLHRLPLSYVDRHTQGELINHLITDADQVSDGLLMGFTQLFTGVLTILGTLILMFSRSIAVSLVVVLLTPLSLFVAAFIAKRTYTMFQEMSRVRGEQTAYVDEMLMGAKVVKAFGREGKTNEAFREINDRLQKVSLKATFFSSLTNPSTRFVNNLVYAGVAVSGAFLALSGKMSVGTLTCFLSYANQYTKPFNEISGVVTELQNAFACAGNLFALMDETEEVPESGNARVLETSEAGEVTLSHVSFSYTPEQKLLEDISLAVKKGQRIAIVGPTGCGKTTLINLLMRFYDVREGSISVAGTDIREMTRKSLRDSYGMVLQEVWLQSGTVMQNLRTGNEDATEEEVMEAAKICHAHNFIMR